MSARDELDRFDAQWRDWKSQYLLGPGPFVLVCRNIGLPLPVAMQETAKERVLDLLGQLYFEVRGSLIVRAREEARKTLVELEASK